MPDTSSPAALARLESEVRKIGCPELLALDGPATAEHLNYLDLMPGRSKAPLRPRAVAEFQTRPILYLVDDFGTDGTPSPTEQQLRDLSQLLANRSEHAMVAVVRPGELVLYPVNLDRTRLATASPVIQNLSSHDAPHLFQRLATGSFSLDGQATAPDYVFNEIYRLLTDADTELTKQLSPLEVLSLAGRALFFRFLRDRKIVTESELAEICPTADDLKGVFSNAECSAATCCWLDETFNGDLLPLVDGLDSTTSSQLRLRGYRKFFKEADQKTGGKIFTHLEAIMRGWKHLGRSEFQTTIDWDDFNFAHIPIGVLSQVYETFSRRWDEVQADQTSVHYTPKNIASLLVNEAMTGVKDPHKAIVLDPACGAGTFLVLAFRQLVRLHWRHQGQRPDKATIQRILYNQIRGFDVSESALRLAALALYITAIEVNGTTRPPKLLKFPRPLKDEVLFNFGDSDERRHGFVLGSLGDRTPKHFDAYFDVVVGNPPWSRLRTKAKTASKKVAERAHNNALNKEFTAITRRALASRRIDGLDVGAYENPDNDPDLPFLWRATEWAKPGATIAMALPARIILKQGGPGREAREAVLRGLTVTGILNGSDLEKTAVWPNMDLPFILLFARNAPSPRSHQFQFVTPLREDSLCERAEFRIDYKSAHAVSVEAVLESPWILKSLSVGSVLDVEVFEKILEAKYSTLGEIWTNSNNLASGAGYIVAPAWPQHPADDLFDLPDFVRQPSTFAIDFRRLETWLSVHQRKTAHAPREAALYAPPLVIVPQTPGEGRQNPKSYLSLGRRVAFSQSFYGYSTAGHPDAEILAQLLYLITHSLFWQHYYLTHSSRIGASYRTIVKEDLDGLPFPEPHALTDHQRHLIGNLAGRLLAASGEPADEVLHNIDELIFGLYGLTPYDASIVRDTVHYCSPYRSARRPAARPPSHRDIEEFCSFLESMVQPFVKSGKDSLRVCLIGSSKSLPNAPMRFIMLTPSDIIVEPPPELLSNVIREANITGASRVTMILPQGGLVIGLLNQLRFWSQSRARLCGLHIIRQHLGAFGSK